VHHELRRARRQDVEQLKQVALDASRRHETDARELHVVGRRASRERESQGSAREQAQWARLQRPGGFVRMSHVRDAAAIGHAQHDVEHARQAVCVAVRIHMRDAKPDRREQRFRAIELRLELALDVARVDAARDCTQRERRERKKAAARVRERRTRGQRRASDDVEMQPDAEVDAARSRVGDATDRVLVRAEVDDQRRGAHDTTLHGLDDAPVHAGRETEVVGIHDEPTTAHVTPSRRGAPQARSPARRSWMSGRAVRA